MHHSLQLRLLDQQVRSIWSGNGAAYHQEIVFGVDRSYPKVLNRLAHVTHLSGHLGALDNPRRISRRSDSARRAVTHRPVRGHAACEAVSLDDTSKSFPLGLADDFNDIVLVEDVHENLVAYTRRLVTGFRAHFSKHSSGRHTGALEVTFSRLVDSARRLLLDQAKLHRVVAVGVDGLFLYDYARASFDDRNRRHGPVFREQLRHPELFTDYSVDHNP